MIRPHKRAIKLNTFSIIKFKMLSVMEFYESADENIKIKNEINRNEKKKHTKPNFSRNKRGWASGPWI